MAVTALVEASAALGEPRWLEASEDAADLLLTRHLVDGRLRRTSRHGEVGTAAGVLEDYACFSDRLLSLHLERQFPSAGEVLVGYDAGAPAGESPYVVQSARDRFGLFSDRELLDRLVTGDARSGTAETDDGPFRWGKADVVTATTPEGLMLSRDGGITFTTVANAPALLVITADPTVEEGLIGVDTDGTIWTGSTTEGAVWKTAGHATGVASAIAARLPSLSTLTGYVARSRSCRSSATGTSRQPRLGPWVRTPRSGSTSRLSRAVSVLLPDAVAPTTASERPGATSKDRSSSSSWPGS